MGNFHCTWLKIRKGGGAKISYLRQIYTPKLYFSVVSATTSALNTPSWNDTWGATPGSGHTRNQRHNAERKKMWKKEREKYVRKIKKKIWRKNVIRKKTEIKVQRKLNKMTQKKMKKNSKEKSIS